MSVSASEKGKMKETENDTVSNDKSGQGDISGEIKDNVPIVPSGEKPSNLAPDETSSNVLTASSGQGQIISVKGENRTDAPVAASGKKTKNPASSTDSTVHARKKRKVVAKTGAKADMEKDEGDTITLFCKNDFMIHLLISKQNLIKEEEERKERGRKSLRKSLNSMTEAEQLKLALEMSMKP